MNMEEQLRAVVTQATTDAELWHNIVHGAETMTVETENGTVPSIAKLIKDIRAEITGGVYDVVFESQQARDEAIAAKIATENLQAIFEALKNETKSFRDETETFKNLAQTVFNNISPAITVAVSEIRQETTTQITNVQTAGATQISLATAQADRAEAAAETVAGLITELSGTSLSLATNRKYKVSLSAAATFVLPSLSTEQKNYHNQIKCYLRATANIAPNFGTTTFVNGVKPVIETGSYEVFWDFHPYLNVWVCGALKGAVAS